MTESDKALTFNELQLINVIVDRISLQSRFDIDPPPPDSNIEWKVERRVSHRLSAPNELRIKLDVILDYNEGSPRPFELETSVIGIYQSREPIDEKDIPFYVSTHSVPLLWPYVRELVSNLSSRTGGTTLVLPTLSVQLPRQSGAELSPTGAKEVKPRRKTRAVRAQSRQMTTEEG